MGLPDKRLNCPTFSVKENPPTTIKAISSILNTKVSAFLGLDNLFPYHQAFSAL
jgi:hypothetical protein